MEKNFLLTTKEAEGLYEVAASLPIVDYHNHISVTDIAADRQYDDITALWMTSDPYKHRLMRIAGIPEHFITKIRKILRSLSLFCRQPRLRLVTNGACNHLWY